MVSIELNNLSKWYGEVIGVSNLNATIEPGVTGLLGPNGAGKSTLFKILNGLLKADTGFAKVNGMLVWNNPEIFRATGYCPDEEKFYEHMTGYQFLIFIARLNGNSKAQAKEIAKQMLELIGLTYAADRKIGGYSKGMRQRIKLAQAVSHDPQVIFLDEPLSGMDPESRQVVVNLIHKWGEEGRIVLVSSHILHEIENMTKRILVLNNGLLLAEGDVFEIRELIDEQPRHVQLFTPERQRLSSLLVECPFVQTIQFGDQPQELLVLTTSPDEFFQQVQQYVVADGLSISKMSTLDENLQSIFDYLVKPI